MTRDTDLPPIPRFRNAAEEARWLAAIARKYGSLKADRLTQTSIRLPQPDLDKARELAERAGASHHDTLRRALRLGLERLEQEDKRK